MRSSLAGRLDALAEAWDEAEISRPSKSRWIEPFAPKDQTIALRLLECMQMHERLCSDIDFTGDFLLGHHSFLYGAPNALARVLLPLFKRIEDFSVDPRESQVGLPADLLDDDIDNAEPVTLHDPRS